MRSTPPAVQATIQGSRKLHTAIEDSGALLPLEMTFNPDAPRKFARSVMGYQDRITRAIDQTRDKPFGEQALASGVAALQPFIDFGTSGGEAGEIIRQPVSHGLLKLGGAEPMSGPFGMTNRAQLEMEKEKLKGPTKWVAGAGLLTLDALTDPTNYIPIGAVGGAAKTGVKVGAKATLGKLLAREGLNTLKYAPLMGASGEVAADIAERFGASEKQQQIAKFVTALSTPIALQSALNIRKGIKTTPPTMEPTGVMGKAWSVIPPEEVARRADSPAIYIRASQAKSIKDFVPDDLSSLGFRGDVVEPNQIPDFLYHTSIDADGVKKSGILLAGNATGLAGEPWYRGVSLTDNLQHAQEASFALRTAVETARVIPQQIYKLFGRVGQGLIAQDDLRPADRKALLGAVEALNNRAKAEGWEWSYYNYLQDNISYVPKYGEVAELVADPDEIVSMFTKEAIKAKGIRDPQIQSRAKELAKVDPAKIGVVEVPRDYLARTGGAISRVEDYGTNEYRHYGDLPLTHERFKKLAPSTLGESLGIQSEKVGRAQGSILGEGLPPAFRQSIAPGVEVVGTPDGLVMYHGTGTWFERFKAQFTFHGIRGKGVYLTTDPRLSGGIVNESGEVLREGYAQTSGVSSVSYNNARITELESEISSVRNKLDTLRRGGSEADELIKSSGSGVGEYALQYSLEGQLKRFTEELRVIEEKLGFMGPQMRQVLLPYDMRLLDETANNADDAFRLVSVAEDIIKELSSSTNTAMNNAIRSDVARGLKEWYRSYLSGTATIEDLFRDRSLIAIEAATKAGYDGIMHRGGLGVPMMDLAGKSIEHTAVVVFDHAIDKLVNKISGTMGGIQGSSKGGYRIDDAAVRAVQEEIDDARQVQRLASSPVGSEIVKATELEAGPPVPGLVPSNPLVSFHDPKGIAGRGAQALGAGGVGVGAADLGWDGVFDPQDDGEDRMLATAAIGLGLSLLFGGKAVRAMRQKPLVLNQQQAMARLLESYKRSDEALAQVKNVPAGISGRQVINMGRNMRAVSILEARNMNRAIEPFVQALEEEIANGGIRPTSTMDTIINDAIKRAGTTKTRIGDKNIADVIEDVTRRSPLYMLQNFPDTFTPSNVPVVINNAYTLSPRAQQAAHLINLVYQYQHQLEVKYGAGSATREAYLNQIYKIIPPDRQVTGAQNRLAATPGYQRQRHYTDYFDAAVNGYEPVTLKVNELMEARIQTGLQKAGYRQVVEAIQNNADHAIQRELFGHVRRDASVSPWLLRDKQATFAYPEDMYVPQTKIGQGMDLVEQLKNVAPHTPLTAPGLPKVKGAAPAKLDQVWVRKDIAEALNTFFGDQSAGRLPDHGFLNLIEKQLDLSRHVVLGFDFDHIFRVGGIGTVQMIAARGLGGVIHAPFAFGNAMLTALSPKAMDEFWQSRAHYLARYAGVAVNEGTNPAQGIVRHVSPLQRLAQAKWTDNRAIESGIGAALGAGSALATGERDWEDIALRAGAGAAFGAILKPAKYPWYIEDFTFNKFLPVWEATVVENVFRGYTGRPLPDPTMHNAGTVIRGPLKGMTDEAALQHVITHVSQVHNGINPVLAGMPISLQNFLRYWSLAPSWQLGQMKMFTDVFNSTPEGMMARRFFTAFAFTAIASGIGITVALNPEYSKDPKKILELIDPRNETSVINPNGKMFMAFRMPGNHVYAPFGVYTPMVKALLAPVGKGVEGGAIAVQKANQDKQDLLSLAAITGILSAFTGDTLSEGGKRFFTFWKNRTSIPLRLVDSIMREKKDEGGRPLYGEDPLKNIQNVAGMVGRSQLPIVSRPLVEDKPAPAGARDAGVETRETLLSQFGGQYTTPVSDRADMVAKAKAFLEANKIDPGLDPVGRFRRLEGKEVDVDVQSRFLAENPDFRDYLHEKREVTASKIAQPFGKEAISLFALDQSQLKKERQDRIEEIDRRFAEPGNNQPLSEWRKLRNNARREYVIKLQEAGRIRLGSSDLDKIQQIQEDAYKRGIIPAVGPVEQLVDEYYSIIPTGETRDELIQFMDARRAWKDAKQKENPELYTRFRTHLKNTMTDRERAYDEAVDVYDEYQQILPYLHVRDAQEARQVNRLISAARDAQKFGGLPEMELFILTTKSYPVEIRIKALMALGNGLSNPLRRQFLMTNNKKLAPFFSDLTQEDILDLFNIESIGTPLSQITPGV